MLWHDFALRVLVALALVEQLYRVTAACDTNDAVHVRSLVLHTLGAMPALVLLEQIVSRVSLEKSVSVVRWALLSGSVE